MLANMRDRWPDFTALHVFGYVNSRQDKITAWRLAEPEGPAPLTAYPVTMLDADPVLSSHIVILKTPFLRVHVDFILSSSYPPYSRVLEK